MFKSVKKNIFSGRLFALALIGVLLGLFLLYDPISDLDEGTGWSVFDLIISGLNSSISAANVLPTVTFFMIFQSLYISNNEVYMASRLGSKWKYYIYLQKKIFITILQVYAIFCALLLSYGFYKFPAEFHLSAELMAIFDMVGEYNHHPWILLAQSAWSVLFGLIFYSQVLIFISMFFRRKVIAIIIFYSLFLLEVYNWLFFFGFQSLNLSLWLSPFRVTRIDVGKIPYLPANAVITFITLIIFFASYKMFQRKDIVAATKLDH